MEVECGWKPRETCKTQAESLPKIAWSEAVWQEHREGGGQGKPVLARWMQRGQERGRTCGPGCRWGGRGHRHGSIQREPADPGGCLTSFHPFSRAEGKRGQCLWAGDATDVRWSLLGQAALGALTGSSSQAGSQLALPSPLAPGSELPLRRGHKSSSASSSSKLCQGAPGSPAATRTAQPHCTPRLPSAAQGLSSGCRRYRAEGFQAVSHRLNGINS